LENNISDPEFICLGLEFLGKCKYDPANPGWHSLTVGDSIAAVALIIAFTQILTPTLKAKIQGAFPKIYILWGTAVVFALVSSVLPLSPYEPWPVLGYPIFWEFTGALLIIIGIADLIWQFLKPFQLSSDTVRRISDIATEIIGSGDEKDHFELSKSFDKDFIHELVLQTKNSNIIASGVPVAGQSKLPFQAGQLVRILADENFCLAVVKRDPIFAKNFCQAILDNQAFSNFELNRLFEQLVTQALLNKHSILHREKGSPGLYRLSSAFFGNHEINIKINPLPEGFLTIHEDSIDPDVLKVYGTALENQLESYLEARHFDKRCYFLERGYDQYFFFILGQVLYIDNESSTNVRFSKRFLLIEKFAEFISDAFVLCEAHECANPSIAVKEALLDNSKGKENFSPSEYISTWIFNFLCLLARTKKYDRELSLTLMTAWGELFREEIEDFHVEVRRLLLKKIREQVSKNLIDGSGSPITRVLIEYFSIDTEVKSTNDEIRDFLTHSLISYYHNLYIRDREMALSLLPPSVKFNETECCLTQSFERFEIKLLLENYSRL
jgi:hypothetical protein